MKHPGFNRKLKGVPRNNKKYKLKRQSKHQTRLRYDKMIKLSEKKLERMMIQMFKSLTERVDGKKVYGQYMQNMETLGKKEKKMLEIEYHVNNEECL